RMSGHQFPMAIPQPPGRARVRLGMELLDLASVGARENPAADLAVTGLTPVAALKLGGVDNSRHWQSFHLSIELIRSLYTIGVGGDSPAISRTGSALILSRCRPITPARTSSRYRPNSSTTWDPSGSSTTFTPPAPRSVPNATTASPASRGR